MYNDLHQGLPNDLQSHKVNIVDYEQLYPYFPLQILSSPVLLEIGHPFLFFLTFVLNMYT